MKQSAWYKEFIWKDPLVSGIRGRGCRDTIWRSQRLKIWHPLLDSLSRRRVTAEWTTRRRRTQPWRCTNPTRARRTQLHCHIHPPNTHPLHHNTGNTTALRSPYPPSPVITNTSLWAAHRHYCHTDSNCPPTLKSSGTVYTFCAGALQQLVRAAPRSSLRSRCEAGRGALFVCVLATL